SKANKPGTAAPPASTPRRMNLRALITLVVLLALGAGGFLALGAVQGRRNMRAYLDAARKAFDKGDPAVALSYVNTYLQGDPKNLDALELRGRILSDIARDFPTVQEAIRVHQQILALDPARMDARKHLVELNLKAGLYRPAQAAAEEYLKRG